MEDYEISETDNQGIMDTALIPSEDTKKEEDETDEDTSD